MTPSTARARREHLGLTQLALAAKMGISNTHLCNLEHGKAQPSARTSVRWHMALYTTATPKPITHRITGARGMVITLRVDRL